MEWCWELYNGTDIELFLKRMGRAAAAALIMLILFFTVQEDPLTDGGGAGKMFPAEGGKITTGIQCDNAAVWSRGYRIPMADPAMEAEPGLPAAETVPETVSVPVRDVLSDEAAMTIETTAAAPAISEAEISPAVPAAPGAEISPAEPAAPGTEISPVVPAVPETENSPAAPAVPETENPSILPDIPLTESPSGTTDIPVTDEEGTAADPSQSADSAAEGFLVDEEGMIYGISDPEAVIEDGYMELPSEGCCGISRAAFAGTAAEISEIYIPSNITHVEEGAFLGLNDMLWFDTESTDGQLFASDGVLYSDGGACLLAFPAARIGFFLLPEHVERLADDAFAGTMLQMVDARKGNVSDIGNLPDDMIMI